MKHFVRIIILALTLFLCAAIGFGLVQLFLISDKSSDVAIKTNNNMIFILLTAEFIRAIPTYWLYQNHSKQKENKFHSIGFGLMCSLLIGSLYIFLAPFELPIENSFKYVINNLTIFILQGVISGYVLWAMFYKFGQDKAIKE